MTMASVSTNCKSGRIYLSASVCLLLATFFIPLNGIRVHPSVALSDVFLLCGGVMLLPRLLLRELVYYRSLQWLLAGVGLILMGSIIGDGIADGAIDGIGGSLRFGFAAFGVIVVIILWRPSIDQLRIATAAWAAACAINGFLAFLGLNRNDYNFRSNALSFHPNHLALVGVVGVGVTIGLLISSDASWQKVLWSMGAVVTFIGILESGSRAGLIGTIITVVSFIIVFRSRELLTASFLTGTVLVIVALSLAPRVLEQDALSRLIGSTDDVQQSNSGRMNHLQYGLDRVAEHPILGSGFSGTVEIHSMPLQIYVASGILGLAGFVAILYFVVRQFFPYLATRPAAKASTLQLAWTAGIMGFFAASVFQNAVWERFVWLPIALLAVLTPLARDDTGTESQLGPQSPSRATR